MLFSLVFRNEATGGRVQIQPFQRLGFRFFREFRFCGIRAPTNSSKTVMLVALALWYLGKNPAARGLVASVTSDVAKPTLVPIKQSIENAAETALGLIFPELRRSSDPNAAWGQSEIVINRPEDRKTVRNPSMRTVGLGTEIAGARADFAIGDDLVTMATAEPTKQQEVFKWVESTLIQRLETRAGRCVIANTPWDRRDVTFLIEQKLGWPFYCIDVDGFCWFKNLEHEQIMDLFGDLLVPSKRRPGRYRFIHRESGLIVPDPDETRPLWPEQYPPESVERDRRTLSPHVFAAMRLSEPLDESAARCHREWIDAAFEAGAGMAFPAKRTANYPTYTGVDIGGHEKHQDLTAIVTIELWPDGRRKILNLQTGNWNGATIVDKVAEETKAYDSTCLVESQAGGRWLAEFARAKNVALRITHLATTAASKNDRVFGVEAFFNELQNGVWIFPAGGNGHRPAELASLGEDSVYYSPTEHTSDRIMALFVARRALASSAVGSDASIGKSRLSSGEGGF